ncbi:uncharacterized protein LOC144451532 [Glandiceps talaboti]
MNTGLLSLFVLLSILVYFAHSKSLLPDEDASLENDITQSAEMEKFKDWFQGEVSEFASELAQEIWKKYSRVEARQPQDDDIKRGSRTRGCSSKWSGWKFMGGCH